MTGERSEGARAARRVWDIPTRIVHWTIVVLFCLSWWSVSNDNMRIHLLSGYGMLALVLFRLVWGVVGSQSARFSNFVKGPGRVWAYARGFLRREAGGHAGHNPMGALSVIALIGLLLWQCWLGLFAVDTDGIESGPLAHLVSFEGGRTAAHWHGWTFQVLRALAGLHIAVALFYLLWKRENLIGAMVTGRQRLASDPGFAFASPWRALLVFALAAGAVWLLVTHPPRF